MGDTGASWRRGLLVAAGLLGTSGVMLGAASAHLGGGDLARLGALFLLLHAAAIPGILAMPGVRRRAAYVVATLLALGSVAFSGDIAVLAFAGRSPLPGLAPAGGLMLMAGWAGLVVAALLPTPNPG